MQNIQIKIFILLFILFSCSTPNNSQDKKNDISPEIKTTSLPYINPSIIPKTEDVNEISIISNQEKQVAVYNNPNSVNDLDPESTKNIEISEDDFINFFTRNKKETKYIGLGFIHDTINILDKYYLKIYSFLEGSPSERSGLEIGDILYSVDNNKSDLDIPVRNLGQSVKIEILRNNEIKSFNIDVTEINIKPVTYQTLGLDIYLVNIVDLSNPNFNLYLEKIFQELVDKGAKSIIIDTRKMVIDHTTNVTTSNYSNYKNKYISLSLFTTNSIIAEFKNSKRSFIIKNSNKKVSLDKIKVYFLIKDELDICNNFISFLLLKSFSNIKIIGKKINKTCINRTIEGEIENILNNNVNYAIKNNFNTFNKIENIIDVDVENKLYSLIGLKKDGKISDEDLQLKMAFDLAKQGF